MLYEFEKEIGVQRALVADLEIKNRSLREIVEASTRKMGGLEEQLSIKKYGYDAHIKRLTEEKERVQRFNSVMSHQKDLLYENHVRVQKEWEQLKSELNETITKQDTVIQELTDEVTLINQQNVGLRGRLEDKSTITNRLDKVLKTFE